MSDAADTVHIAARIEDPRWCVLWLSGVLNTHTYRQVRDVIIKAALDEPDAVIVDVTRLSVPTQSAWAVFTSARWHVSTWPDVPILLAHDETATRQVIARNGIARYVPIFSSTLAAIAALQTEGVGSLRIRARKLLNATRATTGQARTLVEESLADGAHTGLIASALVVVTVFVENVLEHTDSAPAVVVEYTDNTVTIAVEDANTAAACLHEDPRKGADPVSGLAIVAALSRAWGSTPTSKGKTVWAVLGPENAL